MHNQCILLPLTLAVFTLPVVCFKYRCVYFHERFAGVKRQILWCLYVRPIMSAPLCSAAMASGQRASLGEGTATAKLVFELVSLLLISASTSPIHSASLNSGKNLVCCVWPELHTNDSRSAQSRIRHKFCLLCNEGK